MTGRQATGDVGVSPRLDPANADQAAYWNGHYARHWINRQAYQDKLLRPVTERLMAAAAIKPGERTIDVGCGCGETTLIAAAAAGENSFALGVDVSEPMIVYAKQRAVESGSAAKFVNADATARDFSAVAADVLISRLGVMFFADPEASFANLRRGLKPGGRAAFVCWREPKLNPWALVPYYAIRHMVPPQPKLGPEDPGPFSFADPLRLRQIVEAAGFFDAALEPDDFELNIANGEGFDAAVESALAIGPAARALTGASEEVLRDAKAAIRAALEPHRRGESVSLGAAIWIVTANCSRGR